MIDDVLLAVIKNQQGADQTFVALLERIVSGSLTESDVHRIFEDDFTPEERRAVRAALLLFLQSSKLFQTAGQPGPLTSQVLEELIALRYAVGHDELTGLPNRRELLARFTDACKRLPPDGIVALHLLDLNRFKRINDAIGHEEADKVLQEVAGRLNSVVGANGTPARLSGDEFAVLQVTSSISAARRLGTRIVKELKRPFAVAPSYSASIGISLWRKSEAESTDSARYESDFSALLRQADYAMYATKKRTRHRGGVSVFQEWMARRFADTRKRRRPPPKPKSKVLTP